MLCGTYFQTSLVVIPDGIPGIPLRFRSILFSSPVVLLRLNFIATKSSVLPLRLFQKFLAICAFQLNPAVFIRLHKKKIQAETCL